jgi:uncharacterized protein (DUF2141 family)
MKASQRITASSICILIILLIIKFQVLTVGCANIVPPSGGPRDSLPPVLLKASPPDSTVNFRGNRITLEFDEYVDLQDVPANVVVSPTPDVNPQLEVRLRTITIRLRDTLEPNTTYTINFGNAIRDINEANVLKEFDYTFSTGPALDSLELRGKVLLAQTGAIDSTLIVMLHRNLSDSAVVNSRPRYVARVDRSGNFVFSNLPPGTFALYALGDAATGRRYLNKSQMFAFADSPVVIRPNATAPTLYAYREVEDTRAATTPRPSSTDRRLRFTTSLANNQQSLLDSLVITFEQPLRHIDTNRITLTTDSTFNPVSYSTSLDTSKRILTVRSQWQENKLYNLLLDKDFAEDSLGRKLLRSDTISFTTRKRSDYANVAIRMRNVDAVQKPVLQFVLNNAVVFSAPLQNGTFTHQLFQPGDYELRILYDRNGNGIWDPGQFFGTKRQPEIVRPIERRVNIKAGAANDFEIAL